MVHLQALGSAKTHNGNRAKALGHDHYSNNKSKQQQHQQHTQHNYFAGCKFTIELGEELGFLPFAQRAEVIRRITERGGGVTPVVDSDTTAVLSRPHTAAEFDGSLPLQHAVRNGVPIVRCSAYLDACAAASKRLDVADFVVHVPSDSKELPSIIADVTARRKAQEGSAGRAKATPKMAGVRRSVVKAHQASGAETGRESVVWHEGYDETVAVEAAQASGDAAKDGRTAMPSFPVDVTVDARSAGYEVIRLHPLSSPGHHCVELHASLSVEAGSAGQPRFRVFHSRRGGARAAFFNTSEAAEACYAAVWAECTGGAASAADVAKPILDRTGASRGAQRAAGTGTAAASSIKPVPAAIESAVKAWFADAWQLLNERTSAAASGNAKEVLGKVTMLDVYKAEAVLLRISDIFAARLGGAAKAGRAAGSEAEAEELAKLSDAFYAIFPPAGGGSRTIATCEQLADAEDSVRILRAALNVGEEAGGNVFGMSAGCQYRSLGSELEVVPSNWRGLPQHERLRELVIADEVKEGGATRRVTKVYAVRREAEHRDFVGKSVGNCQLLVHGTAAGAVAPILSLGLQVPKAQRLRRDRGMLGRGIYFGDCIATAAKYAGRSKLPGQGRKFYIFVSEVALGKAYETTRHELGLEQPPPGYDSVRGVVSAGGDFTEEEYVVYRQSAQRLRYVLEFEDAADAAASDAVATPAATAAPPAVATSDTVGDVSSVTAVDELQGEVRVKAVQAGLQSKNGEEPVPLRATRVKASIIDLIAEVVILQEYENTGASAIEAKYVFPLQRGAAVCGFEAYINAKRVVGKVKEKEEARREYKKAVEAGHGAYLMDESEEAPDVFTISVGNLPAKTRVVIKITYVIELKVDATRQAIEFVIPASVHPAVRDAELKTTTQQSTNTVSTYGACGDVALEVGLDMPFDIVAVECSHPVERKRTACRAVVRSSDVDLSKGDLTIWTRLAVMHAPRIWVESNLALGTKAAMITFFPDLDESLGGGSQRGRSKEAVIALDASGSMAHGNAAEDAKIGALAAIDKLPHDWRFNVMVFGTRQVWCFAASRAADDDAKSAAKAFVQKLYGPVMGGTNCRDALRSLALLVGGCKPAGATALTGSGLPFLVDTGNAESSGASGLRQVEVLLFSDGLLEQEAEIHTVLRASPGLRVFGVGVGSSCAVSALVGVSRQGRGQTVMLAHDAKSRWSESLAKQVERAGVAALTDIHVEWSTEQSQRIRDSINGKVEQSPTVVASVFSGESSVVYGVVSAVQTRQCELIARHTGVGVRRDQYGQFPEQRFLVTVNGTSFRTGAIIHRLAAKARIRDWVEGSLLKPATASTTSAAATRIDTTAHNEACKAATKAAIIALGCEYGLVTPFTSMIAVEERSEEEQRQLAQGTAGQCTTPSIEALNSREVVDPIPEASYLEEHAERWDRLPALTFGLRDATDATWAPDTDDASGTPGFDDDDDDDDTGSSSDSDAASESADSDGGVEYDAVEEEARRAAALKTVKRYQPLREIAVPASVVELEPDRSVNVFVKTLTGNTVTISVDLAMDTVDDLMNRVEAACGVPASQQRLIFNGSQLMPASSLRRYGIVSESSLHLVLRLRGGPSDAEEPAAAPLLRRTVVNNSMKMVASSPMAQRAVVSTPSLTMSGGGGRPPPTRGRGGAMPAAQPLDTLRAQLSSRREKMRLASSDDEEDEALSPACEEGESAALSLRAVGARDDDDADMSDDDSMPSPAAAVLSRRRSGRKPSAGPMFSRQSSSPLYQQQQMQQPQMQSAPAPMGFLAHSQSRSSAVAAPMAGFSAQPAPTFMAFSPPLPAAADPMAFMAPPAAAAMNFPAPVSAAVGGVSLAFDYAGESAAAECDFAAFGDDAKEQEEERFEAMSKNQEKKMKKQTAKKEEMRKSAPPPPPAASPAPALAASPVPSRFAAKPSSATAAAAAPPPPPAGAALRASTSSAVLGSRSAKKVESTARSRQSLSRSDSVQKDVERVQSVMRENLDRVLARGEALDDLVSRSEDLEQQAMFFQKKAADLRNARRMDEMAPSRHSRMQDLLLLDVVPLSIGFAHRVDDAFVVGIARNTTIPCRKSGTIYAPEDGCTWLDIVVCEGERRRGSDNNALAEIRESVPACSKGDVMGEMCFDIDANGILCVTLVLEGHGGPSRTVQRTITNDKGRLSAREIEEMVRQGEVERTRLTRGARLERLPINATRGSVRAWFTGVLHVELDTCPATGMCLGSGFIEFESAEAVVRAMRSLHREHVHPMDATLWSVVDDLSKFEDATAEIESAPLESHVLFLLGLVSAAHWGSAALKAVLGTATTLGPLWRDFLELQRVDAEQRRQRREGAWGVAVPAAASPSQARLRSLLQLSSVLSDGHLVYPYPVRPAPPAADVAALVPELQENSDATFDFDAAEAMSAVSALDVYESGAPSAGVTSETARYAMELEMLLDGLNSLGSVTAAEMSKRTAAAVQQSTFTNAPSGSFSRPEVSYRPHVPIVDEVD